MSVLDPTYDVIVVGGGHAGSEAAGAAAQMGAKTLLITMNLEAIAKMSCNPAMGGVAKGQLVREIDALGGLSGIVSDESGVQFRMLNMSKGPAMWSPRCQSDRMLYAQKMREKLEDKDHLFFRQDNVVDLISENDNEIKGVVTQTGQKFFAKSVILTTGTFGNGLIHIGESNYGGGRSGERASIGISAALEKLGFEVGRLKTGTPPRVDGRTVDYSQLEEQFGDENPTAFSFLTENLPSLEEQMSCWIGYTNEEVHEVLKEGFDRSPMFNGRIKSIGPRYCPSIEDKINRFADKDRHQLFLEPEGWNTYEMYLNGFSTSLPEDVQYKALRTIPGFEDVIMIRPGYAIEYDYFPPHQIRRSLETKSVKGLFFAGQINGTTGYEEAACQGLMAGINAALHVQEKEPLVLQRSEAYIGVLIDDLINKGTEEPYRMFTSRAEHRILLRQDNADLRLTEIGNRIGLASDERMQRVEKKKEAINKLDDLIKDYTVYPEKMDPMLESKESSTMSQPMKAERILLRPEVSLRDMMDYDEDFAQQVKDISDNKEVLEQIEIQIKYAGYIEKEFEMVKEMEKQENMSIPEQVEYSSIKSLSTEGAQKLSKIRPETIGQASRISGVSASDLSVLMVYLKN
ncbi:tRNA uridine-5-carboxymethylaminomethyl(34) synthesis enzyme MnmG [Gracilimonas sediminicola]|uniref:tRNA uridine 5-carboxymethylaminomethyl modification enzyme MnmG n=1 Tax=Gracilimonas sediminicola TaxID=2952158 RepID=A0A9X2L2T0_9BACT|nr:tRNA uridine-5-carboxymethylaminomethyl(34) synthesis enzyme MnmG [Gracilimonas sediminicola]MCP9291286.1 tRNA uridine-5-carboxymethylaminomethyl(34) synthesis enzyme MnmG [Gracilimonas sediminicola]